jgi:hypothetical protein
MIDSELRGGPVLQAPGAARPLSTKQQQIEVPEFIGAEQHHESDEYGVVNCQEDLGGLIF